MGACPAWSDGSICRIAVYALATACPGIVVTPCTSSAAWALTHAPSGMGIGPISYDIDRLLEIADVLAASGVNWDTNDLDRDAAAAAAVDARRIGWEATEW